MSDPIANRIDTTCPSCGGDSQDRCEFWDGDQYTCSCCDAFLEVYTTTDDVWHIDQIGSKGRRWWRRGHRQRNRDRKRRRGWS